MGVKMKIAIYYISFHHHNTLKLLESIDKSYNIDLIDVSNTKNLDYSNYDIIGFASGIYFQKFHKKINSLIDSLPNGYPKKIFLIYTCGLNITNYGNKLKKKIKKKSIKFLSTFSCNGYDSFGLLKLLGGIKKNHPNEKDFKKFNEFINDIYGGKYE
ncbi:flavodoxin [Coprobacillus sp. CAG:698]|nr:flavodoxin [Coprobacillus sp. CAG:698]